MARLCIPTVWGLKKLDIFSLDVKRIILMKVREAFEQEKCKDLESSKQVLNMNLEFKVWF